jgi:hypothetical protein
MPREACLADEPGWRLAWEMFDDLVKAHILRPEHAKKLSGSQIGEMHMAAHGRVGGGAIRHLDSILESLGHIRSNNQRSTR